MKAPAYEPTSLLARAWKLQAAKDYPALRNLLESVPWVDRLAEPAVGYMLANAWVRLGNHNPALELLHALAGPVEQHGDPWLIHKRANLEGVIHLRHGRLTEAETLFVTVAESASKHGHLTYAATALMNLGIIEDIRCNWVKAIAHYQRALAAYQRLGMPREIALGHHNLALTFRQMGLLQNALSHSEEALRLHLSHGSMDEIAPTETERAHLLSELGDHRLAEATAARALGRKIKLGDDRGKGEALRVLAILARRRGEIGQARTFLAEALDLARATENVMLQAEVFEEQAEVEAIAGTAEGAREAARESARLYRKLGSEPRAERVLAAHQAGEKATEGLPD